LYRGLIDLKIGETTKDRVEKHDFNIRNRIRKEEIGLALSGDFLKKYFQNRNGRHKKAPSSKGGNWMRPS